MSPKGLAIDREGLEVEVWGVIGRTLEHVLVLWNTYQSGS